MNKTTICVCHHCLLEYPFAYHCMHSQYLDFDIWCWSSLFVILNMIILSPQWGMIVSIKAEYVTTYMFQSKSFLKMASLKLTEFFEEYNYILGIKFMNASFVNEFIRCFLPQDPSYAQLFMPCPLGKEEKLLHNEFCLQEQWEWNFVCFEAQFFWIGGNLFKMSNKSDTHIPLAGQKNV